MGNLPVSSTRRPSSDNDYGQEGVHAKLLSSTCEHSGQECVCTLKSVNSLRSILRDEEKVLESVRKHAVDTSEWRVSATPLSLSVVDTTLTLDTAGND